jgi:hypothetical protein
MTYVIPAQNKSPMVIALNVQLDIKQAMMATNA